MNQPLDTPAGGGAVDAILTSADHIANEHAALTEIRELAEYWRGALERAPGSPGAAARREAGLALLGILERHRL